MSFLWSIFTRMIMFVLEFLGLLKENISPSFDEVVDHLALSFQCVQDIAKHTLRGNILSEKQCKDLSPKLLRAVENIQELVSPYEASASIIAFEPALEEFQRIVEEARLLVEDCCRDDWVKASVFQIHNEEVFRELLLRLGLCYNVIYEQAKAMSLARGLEIKVEDLRNLGQESSTFEPASEADVLEDEQTLQRRLKEETQSANGRPSDIVILAGYLLSRLTAPGMSEERSLEDSCAIMYDASTCKVVSDTDLKGTWDKSIVPFGKGGIASCVARTKWLGINCAKKVIFFGEDASEDASKDGLSSKKICPVFRKEAAILASVNHPNIVKFFCCGISTEGYEKQGFIGMELMERSLGNLIAERGKDDLFFPIHVALDIILQIARGMLYMHEYGTAHRDLKPQNVGVSKAPNGTFCVKLLDLGLSKTKVQASKSQSVSYSNTGTTIYRAPEAFENAKAVNSKQKVKWFRADVYSFAVTCHQILSLKEPYAYIGHTALYQRLKDGLRPTLPDDCPKPLSALIKECWAGDFNARPNFWSICERLEKFKHDLLLQGPGAESTKGMDQLQGENVVASSWSYAYIETLLKRRSERRTPAKHLAKVVESEGATRKVDEGHICEGDEGDDAATSKWDGSAISEGGDVAISTGAVEMKNASQRINGGTQPSKNNSSKVLGDADQAMKENVKEDMCLSRVVRGRGEEYSKIDHEVVERSKTNREFERSDGTLSQKLQKPSLRKRVMRAGCDAAAYLLARKLTRHLSRVSEEFASFACNM